MKLGNSKSFFAQQLFVALCKGFLKIFNIKNILNYQQILPSVGALYDILKETILENFYAYDDD